MASSDGLSGANGYRLYTGIIAALAALVLALTQVIGAGDDEPANQAGEIRLEPISYVPDDPFTEPLTPETDPPPEALTDEEEETGTVTPVDVALLDPQLLPIDPASTGAVRSATPDTVGLYGGSLRYSRCARQRLAGFLESSPAKARAWVAALNEDPTLSWSGGSTVRVSQIRQYLFELTPVTLRADTWVTNHGYSGGRATPVQAVLQAGTAVLVDAYGVPRVKCYCGNPLLPPRRFRPRYTGTPWDSFDPGRVLVLTRTTTIIDTFVLYDLKTGALFSRPPATDGTEDAPSEPEPGPSPTADLTVPPDLQLGTGDVQVTLVWSSGDDLDLQVVDPEGTEISFASPASPSGGALDHDDTAGCETEGTHVENVFWPEGGAPTGEYQASVVNFSGCGGTATFELTIRVGGSVVSQDSGVIAPGEESPAVTFAA